jgi:hypothetical protein
VYDYKMIDEDYLLAPVAAAWLLQPGAAARSAAFLAAPAGGSLDRGATRGAALVKNLRYVVASAEAFAQAPSVAHLIGLKPGQIVGEWRDSGTGLGGGHYPYDVNSVLVPAALDAAARLSASGLLSRYLTASDRALFASAARMAVVWREQAPPLFDVTFGHSIAANAVEIYADSQGVPSETALKALGPGALRFHALALSAAGEPIPVMHSDEGFLLLFADPEPQTLDRIVSSWQQALFAAGLARQLDRHDLPDAVRADLIKAQQILWTAIEATRSVQNAELWSWAYKAGHYQLRPFGSSAADADESNAAQLWSTVYLAIRPPRLGGSR